MANLPGNAIKTEFGLVSSRVYSSRLEPDKQSWLGRKLKVFSVKSDLTERAMLCHESAKRINEFSGKVNALLQEDSLSDAELKFLKKNIEQLIDSSASTFADIFSNDAQQKVIEDKGQQYEELELAILAAKSGQKSLKAQLQAIEIRDIRKAISEYRDVVVGQPHSSDMFLAKLLTRLDRVFKSHDASLEDKLTLLKSATSLFENKITEKEILKNKGGVSMLQQHAKDLQVQVFDTTIPIAVPNRSPAHKTQDLFLENDILQLNEADQKLSRLTNKWNSKFEDFSKVRGTFGRTAGDFKLNKSTIGDNQVYKNLKPGNESKFNQEDEKSGQVNTALIAETLHQFLINDCKVESTRAEKMVVDIMENAAIDQTDVLNYVKFPGAFFVASRGENPQGTFKGTFTNSFTWNNGQLKFESHNYYPLLDADLESLNKQLDVGYFVTVPQDTREKPQIYLKTMTSAE